ncbi:MAG: VCBS repeat-containing protein [Planctomycetota bacterium]|nr:VCBS repeat-containing protein [Planctomycetota bacterium]
MNVKELGGPARLLSHSILNVFLFVASASAHAESVAFTPAAEPATGLKAIVQKWHDDELARQGGKFGSHGWWPWGLSAIDYDNDGAPDLIPSHHGAPGDWCSRTASRPTESSPSPT